MTTQEPLFAQHGSYRKLKGLQLAVFLLVFTDARGYLSLTNHPPEEEEKDHEGYQYAGGP